MLNILFGGNKKLLASNFTVLDVGKYCPVLLGLLRRASVSWLLQKNLR